MAFPDNLLYRVYSDSSVSQYHEQVGFFSGTRRLQPRMFGRRSPQQTEQLTEALDNHLHWGNRRPTPFISVYESKRDAFACAMARVGKGETGVAVAYINRDKLGCRLRKVTGLANELRYTIPKKFRNNAKSEWIVLHRIPKRAIVHLRFES
jgi:hypothetical protein